MTISLFSFFSGETTGSATFVTSPACLRVRGADVTGSRLRDSFLLAVFGLISKSSLVVALLPTIKNKNKYYQIYIYNLVHISGWHARYCRIKYDLAKQKIFF